MITRYERAKVLVNRWRERAGDYRYNSFTREAYQACADQLTELLGLADQPAATETQRELDRLLCPVENDTINHLGLAEQSPQGAPRGAR